MEGIRNNIMNHQRFYKLLVEVCLLIMVIGMLTSITVSIRETAMDEVSKGIESALKEALVYGVTTMDGSTSLLQSGIQGDLAFTAFFGLLRGIIFSVMVYEVFQFLRDRAMYHRLLKGDWQRYPNHPLLVGANRPNFPWEWR